MEKRSEKVTFSGWKCPESKTILYEVSSGKANDLLVKKAMQAEPEETWSRKVKFWNQRQMRTWIKN